MSKKNIFLIFLILFLAYNLQAESERENIDVFILLDKSISMENNIGAVTDYVNTFVVDNILIPGDNLLIINFYGNTETLVKDNLKSQEQKEKIKQTVSSVTADGRFTDIGNALDELSDVIQEYESPVRQKYMLLITDGIQEAPHYSKYYSPDGSFNHEFLEEAETIMKQGWKIQVLGIGLNTDAEKIAAELSGTYTEITTDNITPEELKLQMMQKTEDFLSVFKVTADPELIYSGFKKNSFLTMKIEGKNIQKETEIIIESIILKSGTVPAGELLTDTYKIEFPGNNEKELFIPVSLPAELSSGLHNIELIFGFRGNNYFSPAEFYIQIKSKSFFEKYLLHFTVVGLFLLILILPAVFYILNKRKTYSSALNKKDELIFYCISDNNKSNDSPYAIQPDEKLYLFATPSGDINLSKNKSPYAKAVLTRSENNISINIIDKMFISGTKYDIDNILDQNLNFIDRSGKTFTILFKRK